MLSILGDLARTVSTGTLFRYGTGGLRPRRTQTGFCQWNKCIDNITLKPHSMKPVNVKSRVDHSARKPVYSPFTLAAFSAGRMRTSSWFIPEQAWCGCRAQLLPAERAGPGPCSMVWLLTRWAGGAPGRRGIRPGGGRCRGCGWSHPSHGPRSRGGRSRRAARAGR